MAGHSEVVISIWDNAISAALYVHQYGEPKKSDCRKASELVARLLGVGATLAGGAAYVPASYRAGKGNIALGSALAAGHFVGYQAFIISAMFRIFEKVFRPGNSAFQEHHQLLEGAVQELHQPLARYYREDRSRSVRVAILIGAIASGIIATIPSGYAAYVYNTETTDETVAISLFIANMLSDPWVPAYSKQLALERVYAEGVRASLWPTQREKALQGIKKNMIQALADSRKRLRVLAADPEHKGELTAFLAQFALSPTPNAALCENVFSAIASQDALIEESCVAAIAEKVGGLFGYVLALSVLVTFSTFSYDAAALLCEESEVQGAFGGVTFLTTAYLYGKHISAQAGSMLAAAAQALTSTYVPSTCFSLRPWMSSCVNGITTLFTAFSWGAMVTLSEHAYRQTWLEPGSDYLKITAAIGVTLMLHSSASENAESAMEHEILKRGTAEEQEIIQVQQLLKMLHTTVSNASIVDIAMLLFALPDETFEEYAGSTELTKEQLQTYLEGKGRVESIEFGDPPF